MREFPQFFASLIGPLKLYDGAMNESDWLKNTREWRSKRRHTRDNGPVLAAYRRSRLFFSFIYSRLFFSARTRTRTRRESRPSPANESI